MSEQTIWKGTSSHWKNFYPTAVFILSVPLAAWLHIGRHVQPLVYLLVAATALWLLIRWIVLRSVVFEVTSERLVVTHGIFTRVTDMLELYRVRDIQIVQPLLLRFLKLHNICVLTSDTTTPDRVLDFIPVSAGLGEQFRKAVEECREAKRVRAFDIVNEGGASLDTPGDIS